MSLEDFEVIAKIGSGSFSQVYKVRRIQDGLIYAMKKVQMNLLKDKEKENALNEVRILASLNKRNIIGYKEAIYDEESGCLVIIMEYAELGDIAGMIKQKIKQQKQFEEPEVWKALVHMTLGLKTLHDKEIFHRDLKCANVFCTTDGVYKLGDLNVSKKAKQGLLKTQTGTPYYASPEIWRDQPYDSKSDIWSLGCVIYEMCALRPPFMANDLPGLYAKIQKGVYPTIPNRFSFGLQQLLAQMLRLNPQIRPSCDAILSNQYVLNNASQYITTTFETKLRLLQTIQLPKHMKGLSEKLPARKYDNKENNGRLIDRFNLLDRKISHTQMNEERCVGQEYFLSGKAAVSPTCGPLIKKFIYDGSPRLENSSKVIKPPALRRASPYKIVLDDKRLHRISSVQVEQPEVKRRKSIDHILIRPLASRRPTSQYTQDESVEPKKDKVYIQPLIKQLSEQTAFKVKPYFNELPRLNFYREVEELSQRRDRRCSPYEAPKVVVPKSSPFQIDRKLLKNLGKKKINISYLNE